MSRRHFVKREFKAGTTLSWLLFVGAKGFKVVGFFMGVGTTCKVAGV